MSSAGGTIGRMPDDALDRRFTAALAEYGALRAEILQRIQLQQLLLGATATAVAALLSVALAGRASRALVLFVVPYLTSAFGFAYSDHARRIDRVGTYIRTHLWQEVSDLAGGELSSWEDQFETITVQRSVFEFALAAAWVGTAFVLAPLAADAYGVVAVHGRLTTAEWLVWAVGLVVVGAYTAFAASVGLRLWVGSSPN